MSRFHYDEGGRKTGLYKAMLATTCYDRPDDSYAFAMASSREYLHQHGIGTAYVLLQGNCHVDDARNDVVHTFLASDCTDLVFLDADVTWRPEDLARLFLHDADVVGGVYPYRREGRGLEMPVRLSRGNPRPNDDGLLEVDGLPTGFLRISRHVLERLAKDAKTYPGKDGKPVAIIFERTLIDGTRWGGDLHFCNLWRATGGKVYADMEIVLGHAAKMVLYDSLGSFLRRRGQKTLRHVADKIRAGTDSENDYDEAVRYMDNKWGVQADVLSACVAMARQADGPIIEAGSGLSTILMAAATKQTVYCLEHSPTYAHRLKDIAHQAGVTNIGLRLCPIKDGWYDLTDMDLPDRFALGLNDGPPRQTGSRLPFFKHLNVDTVICDDADDPAYRAQLSAYAERVGRTVDFVSDRMAVVSDRLNQQVA